ncbi:hypothetical protein PAXINDRAFT_169082 [Paxillus involutus ATCC 200175]|uniref:Uncharacterized protein n=1 Tax=Paxillus involutus ATCC 200175 TaxID=664439 RepID=A0A0C9TZ74_PAXIN|nr:hypothetical protein PAXINDRAFT_169082 [Paxillus involutus ATCC 200175]
MYAAKFTMFYVIAAFAALASASPVPVVAPEVDLFLRSAEPGVLAREPLAMAEPAPEADVEARICRFGCL